MELLKVPVVLLVDQVKLLDRLAHLICVQNGLVFAIFQCLIIALHLLTSLDVSPQFLGLFEHGHNLWFWGLVGCAKGGGVDMRGALVEIRQRLIQGGDMKGTGCCGQVYRQSAQRKRAQLLQWFAHTDVRGACADLVRWNGMTDVLLTRLRAVVGLSVSTS